MGPCSQFKALKPWEVPNLGQGRSASEEAWQKKLSPEHDAVFFFGAGGGGGKQRVKGRCLFVFFGGGTKASGEGGGEQIITSLVAVIVVEQKTYRCHHYMGRMGRGAPSWRPWPCGHSRKGGGGGGVGLFRTMRQESERKKGRTTYLDRKIDASKDQII